MFHNKQNITIFIQQWNGKIIPIKFYEKELLVVAKVQIGSVTGIPLRHLVLLSNGIQIKDDMDFMTLCDVGIRGGCVVHSWTLDGETFANRDRTLGGFGAQKRVFGNDLRECEYEETDEELGECLKDHDEQIGRQENEMEATSKKYNELKRELHNKQGELAQLHVIRGKVSQIMEDVAQKKKDLEKRMRELNDKYAIGEMDRTRIIGVWEEKERQKKEEIEKYHLSFLRRDETLEKEITESVAKRREFEYKSTHLKKQQNENETKRRSLNEKLQNIKRNQKECVAMKNEISELKLKVAQLNDGEDETRAMEEQITQCQRVQQENRDKMRELNEERRGLRDEAQQHTIFEVKKKQFETARENYNCRFASMKPKIVSVCDRMPSMKSLKREFREKNAALRSSFEGAQKEYNAQETQHSVCESKLSSIARDQERLQESLSGDVIRLSESSLSMDDNIGGLIDEAREAARSKQSEFMQNMGQRPPLMSKMMPHCMNQITQTQWSQSIVPPSSDAASMNSKSNGLTSPKFIEPYPSNVNSFGVKCDGLITPFSDTCASSNLLDYARTNHKKCTEKCVEFQGNEDTRTFKPMMNQIQTNDEDTRTKFDLWKKENKKAIGAWFTNKSQQIIAQKKASGGTDRKFSARWINALCIEKGFKMDQRKYQYLQRKIQNL
eukprot:1161708_1